MFRDNSFAGYPIISQHFCDIDGRLKPFVDLLYSSFSEGQIFICQSLNDIEAREWKFAGVIGYLRSFFLSSSIFCADMYF